MTNRSHLVLSVPVLAALVGCGSSTPGGGQSAPTAPTGAGDCSGEDKQGCSIASDKQRIAAPEVLAADLVQAVADNTAFALDAYESLRAEPGNLFFSPFSISEALAMTWAGARGDTETQIAQAVDFSLGQTKLHPAFNAIDLALSSRGEESEGKDGQAFRLNVANALWGQDGFSFAAPFLDTLAENYGAGMRVVDFATAPEDSRKAINRWVSDRTEDRIPELLPQGMIDDAARLVLTNAIYFNAAWSTPFDPAQTAPADFTRLDGSTVSVPTMKAVEDTSYAEGDGYAALALPYDGNELSMVLVLPERGTFDAFEASLTPDRMEKILTGFSRRLVAVNLPKFRIETSAELSQLLAKLGMPVAFSSQADFSGIDSRRDLSITAVAHKAFVDVDEAGTEAAAATGVVVSETSAPLPAEIHFDRPYLFLIRDNPTGTIVFLGRVVDPSV